MPGERLWYRPSSPCRRASAGTGSCSISGPWTSPPGVRQRQAVGGHEGATCPSPATLQARCGGENHPDRLRHRRHLRSRHAYGKQISVPGHLVHPQSASGRPYGWSPCPENYVEELAITPLFRQKRSASSSAPRRRKAPPSPSPWTATHRPGPINDARRARWSSRSPTAAFAREPGGPLPVRRDRRPERRRRVESTLPMREIRRHLRDGRKVLASTGHPSSLSGVLDQATGATGSTRPPSDEAMCFDIQTMRTAASNMLRKAHQDRAPALVLPLDRWA